MQREIYTIWNMYRYDLYTPLPSMRHSVHDQRLRACVFVCVYSVSSLTHSEAYDFGLLLQRYITVMARARAERSDIFEFLGLVSTQNTLTHMRRLIHTHTLATTHAQTQVAAAQTYRDTHTNTHTHTRAHKYTYTYIHVYGYKHTHTLTHAHKRAHTRTHIHVLVFT